MTLKKTKRMQGRRGLKSSIKPTSNPSFATKDDLSDILTAMNRGFDDIQGNINGKFSEISKTLGNHTTVLDGHTKILERLEGERIFTEHTIQRLEKEIANIKKGFHSA